MSSKEYQNFRDAVYNTLVKYIDMEDGFIVKLMTLRGELIKRDLTKRQVNIINFITALSYGLSKESAVVPNMQDFELCGVGKTRIRNELGKLVDLNVIDWDEVNNLFSLKDPAKWNAPYHKGFSEMRSGELFMLNLRHKGLNSDEIEREISKAINK